MPVVGLQPNGKLFAKLWFAAFSYSAHSGQIFNAITQWLDLSIPIGAAPSSEARSAR